ncbi:MAG: 4'-phosphopantetheinyl transferase superfamily protein [Chromatiales bacterium]|nr:4'-phosphopantetheinyl transferase superfamily protein [Chromatiales bacterium]
MQQPLTWNNRPKTIVLPHDELHLWRVDLAAIEADIGQLSDDERERAERISDKQLKQRFISSRCSLRQILACYIGCHPATINFNYGEKGKPTVAAVASAPQFNMSHADDLAIIAISDQAIGVDIEPIRSRRGMLRVARRLMGETFAHQLETLDPDHQTEVFLQRWTELEACVKAAGAGVFDQRLLQQHTIHACPFQPAAGWVGNLALLDDTPQEKKWLTFTWPST